MTRTHLSCVAAGIALMTMAVASSAQSQTTAYPSATQKFSVTAPGKWNQLYFYDYAANSGTMGSLNTGSATATYNLRSSFTTPTSGGNYMAIFIYDYSVAKWREVFYIADATDHVF